MECSRCPVINSCPKKGSSPLVMGSKKVYCEVIGGFNRKPIDEGSLSPSSLELARKNGFCVSFVSIPEKVVIRSNHSKSIYVDDHNGHIDVVLKIEKIFHEPILSDREKNVITTMSDLLPRSNN